MLRLSGASAQLAFQGSLQRRTKRKDHRWGHWSAEMVPSKPLAMLRERGVPAPLPTVTRWNSMTTSMRYYFQNWAALMKYVPISSWQVTPQDKFWVTLLKTHRPSSCWTFFSFTFRSRRTERSAAWTSGSRFGRICHGVGDPMAPLLRKRFTLYENHVERMGKVRCILILVMEKHQAARNMLPQSSSKPSETSSN